MSLVCPSCGKKVNWMGPSGLCVGCNDKRKKSGGPAPSRPTATATPLDPTPSASDPLGLVGRSQPEPVEYVKGIKRFGWIVVALFGAIWGAYCIGMAIFADDAGIAGLKIGEGGSTRRARGFAALIVAMLGERGAVGAWGAFGTALGVGPVVYCIRFSTDLRNKLALALFICLYFSVVMTTWNAYR